MHIVDTHLHLVYPDQFSYPWLGSAPTLNRPWRIEQYLAEALPLGIVAALHMEVDVEEKDMIAESKFVLGLPLIVGAIAACRPENPGFAGHIERLADNVKIKGVRRVLHQAPADLSQSSVFVEHIRRLANYDLSFDLCVRSDQLAIGQALAENAPKVTMILDHCGAPDVSGTGLDPWREDIRDISRLPNVNAKISGIAAYAGPGWTTDTIRPYIEHVIECFGWDRVVWGSDHPVVTLGGSLTRWIEATRKIIAKASQDEQAKLLHRNAERIYGECRVE